MSKVTVVIVFKTMPQGLKNAVKCVIFNWSSAHILYSFEWCGFNVWCAYILNGLFTALDICNIVKGHMC